MSQPSRTRARAAERRRRRDLRIEQIQQLEGRALLVPFVTALPSTATFEEFDDLPEGVILGSVTITSDIDDTFPTAAPFTSVSLLSPASAFGGDIVRIQAGPGGDFGKGVYAISRGAGSNVGAINRPGVIYRVDPATGRSSVFFDLNTVIANLDPGNTAANDVGASTGLVNWYDLAFDAEGYFDGRPSMFVATVDRSDANKNAIYRVAPDGSFMGAFVRETDGQTALRFNLNPSAVFVPPTEQQTFLRGLFAGSGVGSSTLTFGNYTGLYFDSLSYRPGQDITSPNLPAGVNQTAFFLGPQVGFTSANQNYASPVYSAFTDFGTPAAGGIPATPGFSGVQGSFGELIINNGVFPDPLPASEGTTPVDQFPAIETLFRRFQDIAFDHYGYFSQGVLLSGDATTDTFTVTLPPTNAGSLFVADLGTGLSIQVTPEGFDDPILIPVQGPGVAGVTVNPDGTLTTTLPGGNLGGRIVRIDSDGVMRTFAEGFNTSGSYFADSFVESSLSITFSADGTTLYASDNDGIWQFKTTASLAGSTTGSLIGLNDLRSLGVPYQGQDMAVAVLDTGVDATTQAFRGRVASGANLITNGFGNDDLSAGIAVGDDPAPGDQTGVLDFGADGHGTLVAGVIAQMVPQATILPVNIFNPFLVQTTANGINTNAVTSSQNIYDGLGYIASNPFVADPVRPNKLDRVVATSLGFGSNVTFDSEGSAYRFYPQIVIALKNQLRKFRNLGIAPIAAAGQFGAPPNAAAGVNPPGPGTVTFGRNFADDPNLGDVNGMALPAILNEVISVGGTIPFPYRQDANTSPIDPLGGVSPRPPAPILLGLPESLGSGDTTDEAFNATTTALVAGNINLYRDRMVAASNRARTTDYVAPAIDVPTFRRRFVGDGNQEMAFAQGGTSLSAALVTGSYAVVSSALDYWTDVNRQGVTVDAYLTQPVGARQLNFGVNSLKDLSIYNNPDGINAILAWTAVPANDPNDGQSGNLTQHLIGQTEFRNYARLDLGNAIAAIEGQVALQYLAERNLLEVIDANNNGLITAHELQNFVDTANATGQAEAGAMARLLGGTARPAGTPFVTLEGQAAILAVPTVEEPDQPDVLQRRFNFFDYASDGQLNGSVSVAQLKQLAHGLLPQPDQFVVVDRQRASANGFLLDPAAQRNFADLQRVLPKYEWVPVSAVARFRGISPARFGVQRNELPGSGPAYSLFRGATQPRVRQVVPTPRGSAPDVEQAQAPLPTLPAKPTYTETKATLETRPVGEGNSAADLAKALVTPTTVNTTSSSASQIYPLTTPETTPTPTASAAALAASQAPTTSAGATTPGTATTTSDQSPATPTATPSPRRSSNNAAELIKTGSPVGSGGSVTVLRDGKSSLTTPILSAAGGTRRGPLTHANRGIDGRPKSSTASGVPQGAFVPQHQPVDQTGKPTTPIQPGPARPNRPIPRARR